MGAIRALLTGGVVRCLRNAEDRTTSQKAQPAHAPNKRAVRQSLAAITNDPVTFNPRVGLLSKGGKISGPVSIVVDIVFEFAKYIEARNHTAAARELDQGVSDDWFRYETARFIVKSSWGVIGTIGGGILAGMGAGAAGIVSGPGVFFTVIGGGIIGGIAGGMAADMVTGYIIDLKTGYGSAMEEYLSEERNRTLQEIADRRAFIKNSVTRIVVRDLYGYRIGLNECDCSRMNGLE